MVTLTPEYVAGLFDGEGWLSFTRRKDSRYLSGYQYVAQAGLRMREEVIVRALQERYGGSVHVRPPRSDQHSVQYQWKALGVALKSFLHEVGPLLIAKRQQAELLTEHVDAVRRVGNKLTDSTREVQDDLFIKMKQLNERGIGK